MYGYYQSQQKWGIKKKGTPSKPEDFPLNQSNGQLGTNEFTHDGPFQLENVFTCWWEIYLDLIGIDDSAIVGKFNDANWSFGRLCH